MDAAIVLRPYTAAYPLPLEANQGEVVRMGRRDDQYPGWVWCEHPSGRAGWVAEGFLAPEGDAARLLRDYSGQELTVQPGQRLEIFERVAGWAWASTPNGRLGWLPEANLHPLANRLFLSAIVEHGHGASVGRRKDGCGMVQLGMFLAEPAAYGVDHGPYARAYLPPNQAECTEFLRGQIRLARGKQPILTCLNLAALELEPAMRAAVCFLQAGGEVIELSLHGSYGRYLEAGRLRAMALPENQPELLRWVEAFRKQEIPLAVKLNGTGGKKLVLEAAEKLVQYPLFGLHVNVRDERQHQPDWDLVRRPRELAPGPLWISGLVRDAGQVQALFDLGVDLVGIAEPTLKDAQFISKLVAELAPAAMRAKES